MLVSGAVIFGLLQLPSVFDHAFDILLPRFVGNARGFLTLGLILGEATVFALIAAFVVHLVARTYWVALVGLDSVYPDGVRWDRLRRGPIVVEIARAREPMLRRRIAAVDNFCSLIFAFGFLAAGLVVYSAVLLAVATLLAIGISKAFLHGRPLEQLPLILVLSVVGPFSALVALDRRRGARLRPDGVRARILRNTLLFFYHISGRVVYGPLQNTLESNVSRRVVVPALMGLLLLSIGAVSLQRARAKGEALPGSYAFVPRDVGAQGVDSRNDADGRTGSAAYASVPFIQSDIIHDPYVRLFIPYLPYRDNAVLAKCPGGGGHPVPRRPPRCGAGWTSPPRPGLPPLHGSGQRHGGPRHVRPHRRRDAGPPRTQPAAVGPDAGELRGARGGGPDPHPVLALTSSASSPSADLRPTVPARP